MKQWWRGLQTREQWILITATLLLLLLGLHGLIWQPWQDARVQLEEEIAQRRDDLAWMQQAATRLPAGQRSGQTLRASGNLITMMNQLLVKARLRESMKQMKPVSEREVRLRFEKSSFDRLLRLLGEIERQGLSIRELRLLPGDESGRVNATLVVHRGG